MNRLTKPAQIKIDGFADYIPNRNVSMVDIINHLGKYEELEEICEKVANSHTIYFKDFYGKVLKMDTHNCFAVYSFNTRTIEICKGNYVIHSFQIDEYGKEWWEETELGESIEIVKNVDKVDPRDICPTNSSCDDCAWSGPCMRHPSN